MKRILGAALGLALLSVSAVWPETISQRRVTLAHQWDLDGETADDDQVVAAATLADSTTFTIAAQPDVCRLIDMTVVDADSSITAGTVTLTGTDCLGYARVCTFNFSVVATRGSGVKTIPVSTGPPGASCYLGAITSVMSSALTGEGGAGDTIKVGYTTNSATGWALYGTLLPVGPSGEHGVDPFGTTFVELPITTSGVASTTVTAVGSNAAFTNVQVGDLLLIETAGTTYERKVTARASANSITVHQAILLPTAGVRFGYRRLYFSTDPTDEMAFKVEGASTALVTWSVAANANTGGVINLLECTRRGPSWPTLTWVQLGTTTTASGSTNAGTAESIDLTLLPFSHCRFGWRFGTGDDTDTANESISYSLTLNQ